VDGVETVVQAEVALTWGAFLQTIIDFLIIAGALFIVMKAFNAAADRAKKMREEIHEGLTPDRIKAEAEAKAKAEAEAKAAEEAAAKAKAEEEAAKAAAEKEAEQKAYAAQVECTKMTAELLTEIRDLLKEQSK
jgi:large-conductance mechanosensitive channel